MGLKAILGKMFYHFPLQNKISLESYPDMGCNSYALYQYMLSQGFNKKYKICWFVTDAAKFQNGKVKNVKIMNYDAKGMGELLLAKYHRATSKALIFSNRFMPRENAKQKLIFLQHGSPIKKLREYRIENRCDFAVCASDDFIDIIEREHGIGRERLVVLGSPRTDYLFTTNEAARDLVPGAQKEKMIIWMPTFRQHRNENDKNESFNCKVTDTGLPFFEEPEQLMDINEELKKQKVILVIKPHPAQNLSVIKEMALSNVQFVYDCDIAKKGLQLYEFMAMTDALITDYSSVYFDYLLTDKPIGLTMNDYEEYKNKRGLVFERPEEIMIGEYIYTIEDFKVFVANVSAGLDKAKKERQKALHFSNKYVDAKASKRVYDFLMEQLESM